MAVFRLRIIDGPHAGLDFEFNEHRTFVVGRAPEAHFRLPDKDPYVSRWHFMLEVNPPLCWLLDMNSHNGTKVNGQKVESTPLNAGDKITAGLTTFELLVERSAVAMPDAEPAATATWLPPDDWIERQRLAREQGKPWRVHELLGASAELRERPETLIELIAQEVAFREGEGEKWSLAEYQQAFPGVADVLALVLERQQPTRVTNLGNLITPACGSNLPRCVPVSGTVTLDGDKVPGPGYLYFTTESTSGVSRPGTAEFDAQGRYRATTFAPGDGLLAGKYLVPVDLLEDAAEHGRQAGRQFPAAEMSRRVQERPDAYGRAGRAARRIRYQAKLTLINSGKLCPRSWAGCAFFRERYFFSDLLPSELLKGAALDLSAATLPALAGCRARFVRHQGPRVATPSPLPG